MSRQVATNRLDGDADAQAARRAARDAAAALGLGLRDQTRFATAVSEVARNALQYAAGGVVDLEIRVRGERRFLVARICDEGDGIADLPRLLENGAASSTGLGLSGSRRIVDLFDVATGASGTEVTLGVELPNGGGEGELARRAAEALGRRAQADPVSELAEQNRALRDALAQQEFLVRELHHRTKNNLGIIAALARMQARDAPTPEAREALNTLLGRIAAFSAAHEYLNRSERPGQIDLAEQFDALARSLSDAFGETGVRILCDAERVEIGPELAVELSLIVNEIATNACKHAFPAAQTDRRVTLAARRAGDALELSVSDNGVGLPDAETRLRDSRSLGWRVIRNGVRKIGGELRVEGESGLTFRIRAPLAAARR